jgi:glycosyltransferase involved in cell wall biosynthesis
MEKKLPLSIIIPTKDRAVLLIKTLTYLKKNIFFFNEVIIIDSSEKNKISQEKLNNFKKLNIKYYSSKPSTAFQRNLGLKYINKKNKFIMFLDDDLKFYFNALKIMKNYIKKMNLSWFNFNSYCKILLIFFKL